ncbi:MAG: regulatory protein RecX [Planctomycetota bacterium]|jgi:regulatory protein
MTPTTTHPSTITDLRPLPTKPSVRSVRVDGRVVARLSEDDVATLRLAVGQPWTAELAETVRIAAATDTARRDALRFLGRRALTRHELTSRLARREHAPGIIARVLDELTDQGWLDDDACATLVVEHIMARRPASRARLLASLRSRGVEPDLASRVVDEALREIDPVEAALELARDRHPDAHGRDRATRARRIGGFLARQGFEQDVVETVLGRLRLLDPDD